MCDGLLAVIAKYVDDTVLYTDACVVQLYKLQIPKYLSRYAMPSQRMRVEWCTRVWLVSTSVDRRGCVSVEESSSTNPYLGPHSFFNIRARVSSRDNMPSTIRPGHDAMSETPYPDYTYTHSQWSVSPTCRMSQCRHMTAPVTALSFAQL